MAKTPLDPHAPLLTPSERLANFTNRVSEQAAFLRVRTLRLGDKLALLHFYGVGGIGKTWTLKMLQENAKAAGLPNAFVDLEHLSMTIGAAPQALAMLRSQLSDLEMPRFDLALAWYWKHCGYTKDNPAWKLGGPAETVVDLIDAVAGVPLLGTGIKWLGKRFQDTAIERFLSDMTGQQEYEQLKRMTPDQIAPELTKLFVGDIMTAPYPTNFPDALRSRMPKAVIFLDTFEQLRRDASRTNDGLHERERWVYDLHQPGSQLVIVTAGRDFLRWGEQDADYKQRTTLEQHLVGGLSRADALDFLTKCNINEAPLQEAILAVSLDVESKLEKGEQGFHPFSLGLCADTVDNEHRAEQTIDPATFDMLPSDILRLAQRFLKSLSSDAHELWVRTLAHTPRFDEAAARSMFCEHRSVEQDAAWHILRRYSFVNPAEDHPSWFIFHTRMRDALRETTHDADFSVTHERWQRYWQGRSETATDDIAGLAWYHQYQLKPDEAVQTWLDQCEACRTQLDMAGHAEILKWWQPTDIRRFNKLTPQTARHLQNLGYELERVTLGDRAANLHNAIAYYEAALSVYTENAFPHEWAMTQNTLGVAYFELPNDDRAANLHKAMQYYREALRVRTETAFPQEWAATQNNLGNAYANLPDGYSAANLQNAIECYTAALRVYTEAAFHLERAVTQNNLGLAYTNLPNGPAGDRAANIRNAIACYKAALRVRTETSFPQAWAATQNNLGIAYQSLPAGDRTANLRQAITCYEAALRVRTEAAFPQAWAMTQNNLGNAYLYLPDGDRAANLRQAITCYTAALRVRTEAAFPQNWALTQSNLGMAHEKLAMLGNTQTNLTTAAACFANAERGYTACGITSSAAKAKQAQSRVRQLLEEMDK